MGLTLEQIRQQFNISPNCNDAQVASIARDLGIEVIDFSGSTQPSAGVNTGEDLGNALNGSSQTGTGVSGDAVSFSHTGQTAQDQGTLEQKLAKFFGREYTDGDSAKKQELVKQYIKNIINSKDQGALENLKSLIANTPADSEIAQALLEAVKASNNEELIAALPENFENDVKATNKGNALEQRTNDILKQIYGDQEVKIKSKEVKDGKQRIVTEDGTVIEIPLQKGEDGYDPTKIRSDIQYKIFKNGNVTTRRADGTEEKPRKAVSGEEGYVKDGKSFDEKLATFYPADYKGGEPSLERKKELARRYVAGYLAGKNDATQIGDFKKLLRNTPPDSEMGRVLVTLAGELNDSVINQAIEEVYGTRQTDEAVAVVTDELTNGGVIARIDNEEVQAAVFGTATRHVVNEDNARALANTSTELKAGNQANGVRTAYENIEDENLIAVFRDQSTSRIADYDTDVALDVVQVHIDNDDEEHTGAQNMAGHGHELDASIQKEFVGLMTGLNDENVSSIIADNAYNYDLSNRDDIIRMLQEQGYDKTMEALENARKEYEAQAAEAKAIRDAQKAAEAAKAVKEQQAKADKKAEQKPVANDNTRTTNVTATPAQSTNQNRTFVSTPVQSQAQTNVPVSSSAEVRDIIRTDGIAKAVTSESFRTADTKTKESILNSLNKAARQEAIQSIVEGAQGFQLDAYMFSSLKNDILRYLVSNPTPKNTEKLTYLQRYLSPTDKKMLQEMKEQILESSGQRVQQEPPQNGNNNPSSVTSSTNDNNNNPFKFGFLARH